MKVLHNVLKFDSKKHGTREQYLWVCPKEGWCSVGAEVVLFSVRLLLIINIVIVNCHLHCCSVLTVDTLKWWPGYRISGLLCDSRYIVMQMVLAVVR